MKWLTLTLAACTLVAPALGTAKEPPSADMTGKQEHSMANCPSTVPGAKSRVENRKDGVALTVTGSDAAAAKEIQRRASLQANIAAQPARGAIEHTGEGTGSGERGFCPGMEQGSLMTVDNLSDGVRIIVRAESAKDVAPLQKSTRDRLGRLEAKR